MLGSYWTIVRQLILDQIRRWRAIAPIPSCRSSSTSRSNSTRALTCFAACRRRRVESCVTTLVDILLSSEPDDLQAAPEWSYDQVTSVDRFIEECEPQTLTRPYTL